MRSKSFWASPTQQRESKLSLKSVKSLRTSPIQTSSSSNEVKTHLTQFQEVSNKWRQMDTEYLIVPEETMSKSQVI